MYESLTCFLPDLNTSKAGEWYTDKKNDGTREHPEFSLNKYGEILKEQNIEWGTRSMCASDVSSLSGQQVMALLMGAVRAERFCDGALK